ncbi:immunity-related GTPase family M protein 2-like isoform X2 [Meriones unguiculatus]|nr:immunity-related GTPase family M protein 2-like isoform X2 [Meriones unguiculatus]XP_021516097.1 immunity-related GTPase family M protein-like isoform X2 [Meriones unguiculatus]
MEEADGSLKDKRLPCFSDAVLIHKDSNILSVEVIESMKAAVAGGKWEEVASVVKELVQKTSRKTVKIAVTGDSGNGMSSFINAIRGIGHEEVDSAPTGVVRTTQVPACYSSSSFPNVELWDLPGTGATAQSIKDYMEEMQFNTYKLFIIVASEQFSSNHVKLAKAVQEMEKRFYVVWTKLDRDLSMSALSEAQLLQSIRRNIQENLQKEQVKEPPIFLLSHMNPLSHDFPELRETLQKDLFNIRKDGLLGTLFHIGKEAINERVKSIRSMDADNLCKDFGISNPDNVEESQKAFEKSFGVDDESLAMQFQDQQGGWPMTCWLHSGAQLLLTGVNKMLSKCFSGLSPTHSQQRQRQVLDEVAKKTKNILWKILEDSTNRPLEGPDN